MRITAVANGVYPRKTALLQLGGLLLLLACMTGCKPAEYAAQADKTAQTTIAAGQTAALGTTQPFDIAYRPFGHPTSAPASMPASAPTSGPTSASASGPASNPASGPASRAGDEADDQIDVNGKMISVGGGEPTVLTLDDALEIAFRNNRAFQTKREDLYIQGLRLANAAREWEGILFGGNVGAAAAQIRAEGVTENGTSLGSPLNASRRFAQGGVFALVSAMDMAGDFGGIHTQDSLIAGKFTQPLLRGAWRDFAYEPYYRLQRDFIFSVYDYERYTQTFAVQVVSAYYDVLKKRDELENESANIERLQKALRWTSVSVEAGQASVIEKDQAEAKLLEAQVRFQGDQQGYLDAVDKLKVFTLAMPISASIEVDYPGGLERLRSIGPRSVSTDQAKAVEVALSVRPEVLSEGAKVRDAQRNVEMAADRFNPQVDVTLGLSAGSGDSNNFYQLDQLGRNNGLNVSVPVSQVDSRDEYRRSLIALDRARRGYDEFIDGVSLNVRASYRSLEQSRRSYELQQRSVQIAVRRSRLAALEQQQGQASARDVLEAEEALRNAQNGLTKALVDYTTTRLGFMASLGMLWVDQKGSLNERDEPFTFDNIQRRYPYVKAN